MEHRVSVVIVTRDRLASLGTTLAALRSMDEAPAVVVVDNGSTDGTAGFVRREHPDVRLIEPGRNLGAAARTLGVRAAETPYVAFCDDDSWWETGSLTRAADSLDAHSRLALVAARVLVGPDRELDPTCAEMAASPIPRRDGLPGPAVLGFLACGAVVRRSAYLEVGGFEPRFGVGGEEELLAMDLAAAGWGLAYCDDLVAHHHPGSRGPRPGRRRRQCRNALWSAWLRRPLPRLVRRTAELVGPGLRDPEVRGGLADALRALPWVLRARRPLPSEVERSLRRLER